MVEARAEESEVTRNLNDEVDDFVCMIKKNVQKLQEEAEKPEADKRFWLYASQAAVPATGLLTRLAQPEKPDTTNININNIDLSKLSDEDLNTLETVISKAMNKDK